MEVVLIISFKTQDLRDCCASLERAEAAIGSTHAQYLITVLSDAEAAETAGEFLDLYAPNAVIDGNSISVSIGTHYSSTFVAIGAAFTRNRETAPNWGTVRRLKMMDLTLC